MKVPWRTQEGLLLSFSQQFVITLAVRTWTLSGLQATNRNYMFVGILGSERPENVLVLFIPYPCQGRG